MTHRSEGSRLRALAVVLVAAAGLAGCSTTQEKSALLERQAKRLAPAQQGLSIARQSTDVRVTSATIVHGAEAAAAIITVRNTSSHALRGVPIAIAVKDASGRALFQNDAAGLEGALVSIASLPAHGTLSWVDDQVPARGRPATVSARIGQSPAVREASPALSISKVSLGEDPASGLVASGTIANRSAVAQQQLVLFGVARRAGRVVAAGRGVLGQLPAHASAPFQIFLVGDARGAHLEIVAPATTFRCALSDRRRAA